MSKKELYEKVKEYFEKNNIVLSDHSKELIKSYINSLEYPYPSLDNIIENIYLERGGYFQSMNINKPIKKPEQSKPEQPEQPIKNMNGFDNIARAMGMKKEDYANTDGTPKCPQQ